MQREKRERKKDRERNREREQGNFMESKKNGRRKKVTSRSTKKTRA